MEYNFFLVFLLAHLLGDFTLQTNRIAKLKAESKKGVLLHCIVVTITQVVFLSFFGIKGAVCGVVSGIIHYFVDYIKGKINRFLVRKQFVYFLIDQAIHILVIMAIVLFVRPGPSIFDSSDMYTKILIVLIIAAYVSTVAAKILVRDLYKALENQDFFQKRERAIDAATALIILGIWFLPKIMLILVPVLAYIYYSLQIKLYGYGLNIISSKYSVLLFTSTLLYIFLK